MDRTSIHFQLTKETTLPYFRSWCAYNESVLVFILHRCDDGVVNTFRESDGEVRHLFRDDDDGARNGGDDDDGVAEAVLSLCLYDI